LTVASGHGTVETHRPEPAGDEVWGEIVAAGIGLMRIPTPFAVGRVNCWLIEDEPLTLLDTGPNSGTALDELEHQLGALGRRIEEIELVVISHQHIDHLGLAGIVARRSGAEVAAIEPLVPYLESYSERSEAEDTFAAEVMRRHGIPEDLVIALRAVSAGFRGYGGGAEVGRVLRDGETLELRDRRLEIQHRPGHSPTDTLLWDAEREILLGADHLIGHISSNPLLSLGGVGEEGERPRALVAYIESLRRTRELPAKVILPGHGEPVVDHRALIDSRFELHRRRAEKLHGLIGNGPMTAHELAHSLWGNIAVTQAFLTLSEVIGHLDLLVADGRAVELEGDVIRFEATGAGNPDRVEG
jgi:glyoxylase-like metal-dependent hydrolase (beta-lactamase superfamily II)